MVNHLTANLETLQRLGRDPGLRSSGVPNELAVQAAAGLVRAVDGRVLALHSRRNPHEEARRQLEAALAGQPAPAVIAFLCCGLGYVIDATEDLAPESRLIVIEPDPDTARALLARRDYRVLFESGRLTLLCGPRYQGASEAWRLFDAIDLSPAVIANPVMARERPETVREARELLARLQANGRENAIARDRFAVPYLLSTLRNSVFLAEARDVRSAFGLFADVPAIVVAAGPSLDANIEGLRAAAPHALTIAVDTAFKPLLAAGIEPALVVGVDPGAANVLDFVNVPRGLATWLVTEGSLSPPVLAAFRGQTLAFRVGDHEPWPYLRRMGIHCSILRAWSSILVTAIDLALRLGCRPIALVGADMAFPAGRPYCSGVEVESLLHPLDVDRLPLVEDVHGRPVRTKHAFVSARDWILANLAGHAEAPLLNATEGGILHGPGIEQIRAGELLDRIGRRGLPDLGRLASLPRIASVDAAERALRPCLGPTEAPPGASPVGEWVFRHGDRLRAEDVRAAAADALAAGQASADGAMLDGTGEGQQHIAQLFSSPGLSFREEESDCRLFKDRTWSRLRFEVLGGRLRFDPTTRPCLVEISRISVAAEDGTRWTASAPPDFDDIWLGPDTYRIPDPRFLVLLAAGSDPVIVLPDPGTPWRDRAKKVRVRICLRTHPLTVPPCSMTR